MSCVDERMQLCRRQGRAVQTAGQSCVDGRIELCRWYIEFGNCINKHILINNEINCTDLYHPYTRAYACTRTHTYTHTHNILLHICISNYIFYSSFCQPRNKFYISYVNHEGHDICAGQVRLGQARLGQVRFGSVQFGSVRFGSVRFGSVRFGSIRFDSIRLDQIRLHQARLG